MGLASALTTALSGLTAAEAKIDVVGNNLANSQTVGFKESDVTYSSQFLQTLSLGSAPTDSNGGTNPQQFGLGTRVSSVTANHTQGPIEPSSNATDIALQGDGMFVVQGSSGEQLYTRAGIFTRNADNELVTPDGNRLLGYPVDDDFQLQTTTLAPVSVPIGISAVAQATTEVKLEGTLPPIGDIADTAQVIQSQVLGDGSRAAADNQSLALAISTVPATAGVGVADADGGGTHPEGVTYQYRVVYLDSAGTESAPSGSIPFTTSTGNAAADNTINLTSLPAAPAGYSQARIYRTAADGSEFFRLTDLAPGATSFTDDNSVALSSDVLDDSVLTGSYSYVVTFGAAGLEETRPAPLLGPVNVSGGRVQLGNLPTPPSPYDTVNVYRTTANDPNNFYYVGDGTAGQSITDGASDSKITDLSITGNRRANLNGPSIDTNTRLVDIIGRDGLNYTNLFEVGTLEISPDKGGKSLGQKSFEITADSTINDLATFLEQANGIVRESGGVTLPISVNNIEGESGTLVPGVSITGSKIRIVSNNGEDNAINVDLGSLKFTPAGGSQAINSQLAFNKVQDAVGQGSSVDFVVYDSLGIENTVRVTTVLERRDGNNTYYRWYAESPDNDPASGSPATHVGSGLITLDGEGNLVSVSNSTVTIARDNTPSLSPLQFDLNYQIVNGLAANNASLTVSGQDGAGPGTLSDFAINRDGTITGIFTNDSTRVLGRIPLAMFSNPAGLTQRGQNLYANGPNAGVSIRDAGANGSGELISGALELSNTDIGRNLIDLSLASTLYRGNSRVITTSQTLLDELLNLSR